MIAPALALALLSGAFAPMQPESMPLSDPALETRVQALGKQLRCTVCQGMSIADSPSQTAKAMMATVRNQVSEGKSDQEILDFFVDRYDDWVLLNPPRKGFAALVWVGPVAAVLFGFVFVLFFIRSRNQRTVAAQPAAPPPGDAAEDPYLKAVRAELER